MRRALLLAAVLLVLAGCGSGIGAERTPPSTVTAVTTVTQSSPAASDEEAAYLADLESSPSRDQVDYVTAHAANLIRFGHGICDDLRAGVSSDDEYSHVTDQLAGDPAFEAGLGTGPEADSARKGQAAIIGISIVLAARLHLCPDAPQSP